jgi:uncharacterized membrane protein (GlpM family)
MLITNPMIEGAFLSTVILNTLFLALDSTNQSENFMDVLQTANLVFTLIFVIEVSVKSIGMGLQLFLQDSYNKFDALIVILSILEMQYQVIVSNKTTLGSVSAFRAFRLFKFFKLAKNGDLSILIDSIMFTITSISDYVILLIIFIYIFALLGMSFFAGQVKFDALTG